MASTVVLGSANVKPFSRDYTSVEALLGLHYNIAHILQLGIGGGLGLAVMPDFRVTCAEARFAANFTRLGFHPGFSLTFTLPRLIGQQKTAMMFYTGRRIAGEEAFAMGLADKKAVFDFGEGDKAGEKERLRADVVDVQVARCGDDCHGDDMDQGETDQRPGCGASTESRGHRLAERRQAIPAVRCVTLETHAVLQSDPVRAHRCHECRSR